MATTPVNEAPPKGPPSELSEAEFLRQQAQQAQKAMRGALRAIGGHVGNGVDPRVWTREHPLAMLGGAIAAGFVAARVITREAKSSPPPQAATSHNSLNSQRERAAEAEQRIKRRRRSALVRRIINEAVRLLQPAISGFVMSQIRPHHPPDRSETPEASLSDPLNRPHLPEDPGSGLL